MGTTRDDLNGLRGRVLDYNSSTGRHFNILTLLHHAPSSRHLHTALRYTIRLKASVGGFLSEVALKPENVTDAALVDRFVGRAIGLSWFLLFDAALVDRFVDGR